MTRHSTPLNQALPAEIAAGSPRWWLAYRRYPVFSAPWVVRRALLLSLIIAAWGALSGLGHYAESQSIAEALRLFGPQVTIVGFQLLGTLTPIRQAPFRLLTLDHGCLLDLLPGGTLLGELCLQFSQPRLGTLAPCLLIGDFLTPLIQGRLEHLHFRTKIDSLLVGPLFQGGQLGRHRTMLRFQPGMCLL
ncbi:MAG: hypothetical protein ACOC0Q_07665, partial [Wenzhouxiangella sp.]